MDEEDVLPCPSGVGLGSLLVFVFDVEEIPLVIIMGTCVEYRIRGEERGARGRMLLSWCSEFLTFFARKGFWGPAFPLLRDGLLSHPSAGPKISLGIRAERFGA